MPQVLAAAAASRPAPSAIVAVRTDGAARVAVLPSPAGVTPFRHDSRVLLYSFTKTMVAAALLRFVAEGRIGLDETMARWLPDFAPARRITLRQMLSHTAGLPDYGDLPAYHAAVRSGEAPWTEAEFLARTEADRLRFEPGAGWAYSNIGYMLLKRVLERAGDGEMGEVLQRVVFDPLGASTACLPTDQFDFAALAFGPSAYLGRDDVPAHYHPGWIATGVVAATVADAALLLDGILGDYLPATLRDAMMRPAHRFDTTWERRPWRRAAYGLGLMMELDERTGPYYGHTGGGPGVTPAVYRFAHRSPPLTVAIATDGEDQGIAEHLLVAAADSWPDLPAGVPGL